MRLTKDEVQGLIKALSHFINQDAELRLFGSRVRDTAKGGDIDLLLIVRNVELLNNLLLNKHYVLAEIKDEIGDQKIDLKIVFRDEIPSDPFLKQIYSESIILYQWPK